MAWYVPNWLSTVWQGILAWHGMAWCGVTQNAQVVLNGMACQLPNWLSIAWYGVVVYGMAQVAFHGMAAYGMVWDGRAQVAEFHVWHGMVWLKWLSILLHGNWWVHPCLDYTLMDYL